MGSMATMTAAAAVFHGALAMCFRTNSPGSATRLQGGAQLPTQPRSRGLRRSSYSQRRRAPVILAVSCKGKIGNQMLLKAFGPSSRGGEGLRADKSCLCPCSSSGSRPPLQHSGGTYEGFSTYRIRRAGAVRCSLSQRSLADQRNSLGLCHCKGLTSCSGRSTRVNICSPS